MESSYEKGEKIAFQELGKFLATFEHTAHTFRENISFILKEDGLQNKIYSDILLNRLTAEPISTIFQTMIYYHFDKQRQIFLNDVIKEFKDLIEVRNIVIHCYWIIGVGFDDESRVSMYGLKQKNSKAGAIHYNLNLEIEEVKKLNKVCNDFCELCHAIQNRMERGDEKYDDLKETLTQIKFKPFINHFNRIN